MIGMTSKSTNAAALEESKITDPSSLMCDAVIARPDNKEFQYWIERYGLSAQHIKLLMPMRETQKMTQMVKVQ